MSDESLDHRMSAANPTNEAERVFDLIDKLRSGQSVCYRDDVNPATVWRANFIGQPSYRHANRIAMLREFLESLLPVPVETVAAEIGSVVVVYASSSDSDASSSDRDAEFNTLSEVLATSPATFTEIAARIGLRSLSFGAQTLTF